jgi:hypothetical protein
MARPISTLLHLCIVVLLTLLTQLGGIAWLFGLMFRRSWLVFIAVYTALSLSAVVIAPHFGRVPLSCFADGSLQMHSMTFCVLNRNYMTPAMRAVANDLSAHMDTHHPGAVTLVLDGSFPFLDGFPLLPHLSHTDGRKLDIAFWYQQNGVYVPGATRSPIGYFAFEDGPSDCPPAMLTLRWTLAWLQPLWRDYELDRRRTQDALSWLGHDPRVAKVFVEPHLKQSLGINLPNMRFQGCRAARHDDHIHFQI